MNKIKTDNCRFVFSVWLETGTHKMLTGLHRRLWEIGRLET